MAKTISEQFDDVMKQPINTTGHSNPEMEGPHPPPDWLTKPTTVEDLHSYIFELIAEDDTNWEEERLLSLIGDMVNQGHFTAKNLAYIEDTLTDIFIPPEDEEMGEAFGKSFLELVEAGEYDDDKPTMSEEQLIDELKKRIRHGKKQTFKPGYRKVGGKYTKIKATTKQAQKRAARKRRHRKVKRSTVAKAQRSRKRTQRRHGAFLKRQRGK
jgi:hypothetical protein